jgi:hypothetical protein
LRRCGKNRKMKSDVLGGITVAGTARYSHGMAIYIKASEYKICGVGSEGLVTGDPSMWKIDR